MLCGIAAKLDLAWLTHQLTGENSSQERAALDQLKCTEKSSVEF